MRLALIVLLAVAADAQEPYTKTRADGPRTLVIAYRCNPDMRVRLRQKMTSGGVARFERWKQDGVFESYHVLFNSYLDSETYDMLALLTFRRYSDADRWRQIEKTMPGGLSEDTLPLITSAVTYPVDGLRQAAAGGQAEPGRSVFFIIPYDYLVSTDEYVKYLDTYVIPQVTGWISEGVLATYNIYLGRYATSRPWGSLFVLEYRDWEAFGKREATVAKVRERLRSNPTWLAASENKQKIRTEGRTIIAEELLAR